MSRDERVTFAVGGNRCTVIRDAHFDCPLEYLLAASQRADWGSRLDPDGRGSVELPVNCCLIEADHHVVLVDGGDGVRGGRPDETNGSLLRQLGELGLEPDDVDTVIITHVHSDHVAGLLAEEDDELVPLFRRARHVLAVAEQEEVLSGIRAATRPPELAAYDEAARNAFVALRESDLVDPIPADAEVVPGIRMLHAPGHTAGHSAVSVEAADQTFIYLADTLHFELELELTHLHGDFDYDSALMVASRRRMVELALERDAIVAASHLHTLAGRLDPDSGNPHLATPVIRK